ncbi:MAG: helix-turn-helix transcriptional regulator, partial [Pseudomonadota bacterium]
ARLTASRIRDGREEYYPEELVAEIIAGANPVRTFREYRRLTASEVARQAGVNQSYISEIENGRKPGSASALKRIAQALRVEMELLISDDG